METNKNNKKTNNNKVINTNKKYNLERFIIAQDNFDSYKHALSELKNNKKQTCWMWYVFPQLLGLGTSEMCQKYGINGLEEAEAYWNDKLLSQRLRSVLRASIACFKRGYTPLEVFGPIDIKKLQSCATLFMITAFSNKDEKLCWDVLEQGFNGEGCNETATALRYEMLKEKGKRQDCQCGNQ